MSQFVECVRCGSDEMHVVPSEDRERPALWCVDCGEPVAYPDE